MSGNAQQAFDLNKILSIAQEPTLQKLLSGGAVTLQELLAMPPHIRAIIAGQAQPALAPPDQPAAVDPAASPVAPPAKPTAPAAPAAPVAAPSTPTWLKNLSAGIAMVAGSLGLSAAGIVGAPIGPDATTTGMLLPLLSAGVAALGVPAPVINMVGTLFGALRKAGSQTAA